jgi:hypothetical protein
LTSHVPWKVLTYWCLMSRTLNKASSSCCRPVMWWYEPRIHGRWLITLSSSHRSSQVQDLTILFCLRCSMSLREITHSTHTSRSSSRYWTTTKIHRESLS